MKSEANIIATAEMNQLQLSTISTVLAAPQLIFLTLKRSKLVHFWENGKFSKLLII